MELSLLSFVATISANRHLEIAYVTECHPYSCRIIYILVIYNLIKKA